MYQQVSPVSQPRSGYRLHRSLPGQHAPLCGRSVSSTRTVPQLVTPPPFFVLCLGVRPIFLTPLYIKWFTSQSLDKKEKIFLSRFWHTRKFVHRIIWRIVNIFKKKNTFTETLFLHVIFQYPSSQISYGSWRTHMSMWTRHLTVPRWARRVSHGMSPSSQSSRDWSGLTTRDSATQKVTVLMWLLTLLSRITTRFR